MRATAPAVLAALVLVLACEADEDTFEDSPLFSDQPIEATPDGPRTLRLRGLGYDVHEGRLVSGVVRDARTGAVTGRADAIVRQGAFQLWFPDGTTVGESFRVTWFVDVDGDAACSVGADPAWSLDTGVVRRDVVLPHLYGGAEDPGGCAVITG